MLDVPYESDTDGAAEEWYAFIRPGSGDCHLEVTGLSSEAAVTLWQGPTCSLKDNVNSWDGSFCYDLDFISEGEQLFVQVSAGPARDYVIVLASGLC